MRFLLFLAAAIVVALFVANNAHAAPLGAELSDHGRAPASAA